VVSRPLPADERRSSQLHAFPLAGDTECLDLLGLALERERAERL
jgi:hypothetical protein